MNTQNYALSFLNKTLQPGVEMKKTDTSPKDTLPSFKNILNDRMANPASSSSAIRKDKKVNTCHDQNDVKEKPEPQFRSYKEITASNSNKKLQKSDKFSRISDHNESEGQDNEAQKADVKDQVDFTLQSLAAILGINPQDFEKMLEKMDIKPEDLLNSVKLESVIDKISAGMNLDEDQKKTLETVIEQVVESVEKSFSQVSKGNNITDASQTSQNSGEKLVKGNGVLENTKVKAPEIIVSEADSEVKSFEEVMNELKQKLNVLRDQLQQNPRKLLEEIAEEVKSLMAEGNEAGTGKVEETATDTTVKIGNADDNPSQSIDKKDQDINSQQKANEDSKDSANQRETEKGQVSVDLKQMTNETAAKNQDNTKVQFDNPVQTQINKANDMNEIPKAQKEIPIQKNEIIHQVIEKAKVVLTGDKSEMVMDLKPDSLGKISLKVVTERGMVVAQFVAENQQVKETLEANMQLLKDSLQKQGLSVQGFSVSVDQNPYRGFNMNSNSSANSRSNHSDRQENSVIGQMVNVANIPESSKTMNPYAWSESKINLTA